MLVCAPALLGGMELDDVFHALRANEPGFLDSAFTFISDGPRPGVLRASDLPWWTEPTLHIDLWRPVSALTHALDYRLWPGTPWAMHLHSLSWYGLLVALVLRAHRVVGGPVDRASLATLLFAVSQAHAMNVGWVSGRNSLIGVASFVVVLLLHRRWRTDGWTPGCVMGPLVFGLALLANEGAVAGMGYLLAFALVLDRGRHRLTALLPYVGVVVVWRMVYVAQGHGVAGSSVYFDPLSDPLVYSGRTVIHGTVMLAGSLGLSVIDALGAIPGAISGAFVVAIPWLAVLAWAAWPRLREDPSLRMWALGAVLACFTTGTQIPTDRGLLMLHLGTYPLLAALILRVREGGTRGPALLGRGLLVLHLLQSLLLPLRVTTTRWLQQRIDAVAQMLPTDPGVQQRTIVLLNVPSDLVMLYSRALAQHRGVPFPAGLSYLYAGAAELTVQRTAPGTLELSSPRPWLSTPIDRFMRQDLRIPPGLRMPTRCTTVEVLETDDEQLPARIQVELHAQRPGCTLSFMAWQGEGPRAIELPAVGEALVLEPVTVP